MDHEMIRRVSKAILETPNASDYETLVAINAIKALREPTMSMEAAAANWQGPQMTYSDLWRSMLDSIINE